MPQPLKRWIDIKGVLFETANEIPRSETYALDMLAYRSRAIRGCILLSRNNLPSCRFMDQLMIVRSSWACLSIY